MAALTKKLGKIITPNTRFAGMAKTDPRVIPGLVLEMERVIREQQTTITTLADAVRELQEREEAR